MDNTELILDATKNTMIRVLQSLVYHSCMNQALRRAASLAHEHTTTLIFILGQGVGTEGVCAADTHPDQSHSIVSTGTIAEIVQGMAGRVMLVFDAWHASYCNGGSFGMRTVVTGIDKI